MVLEEFLDGEELSLLALCDGERAVPLAPAQDYKRALDGDEGPNTGGMGSYSPVPGFDPETAEELARLAHQPIVDELRRRGTPYHGILYAGLMLTSDGPRVLEFNCRFGDPETQAVLPRLRSDLVALLEAAVTPGGLAGAEPEWSEDWAVTVVLAAGGYPGVVLHGRRDHRPRRPGRRRLPRGHGRGGRRDRDRGRPRAERDRARRRCGGRAPSAPTRPPSGSSFDGKQMRTRHSRARGGGGEGLMREEEIAPVTETEVEHQFDELDVDAPRVGIVMGSKSDMPVMEKAGGELEERGIRFEIRVMSAHRDPDTVADYAKNAKFRGLKVIIAGAGLAAALPGVVAAHTGSAGDRRAAHLQDLHRGRPRRSAGDRADAARRAGGVRGRGQRPQRRRAGGEDPGRLSRDS